MGLSNFEMVRCVVSVRRGSELDIRCASEPPPITNASDLMKAICSALLWTAPASRSTSLPPTSTSTQTQLISTAPTVTAGIQSIPTALTSRPVLAPASSEPRINTSPVPVLGRGIDVQGVYLSTCIV